MRDFLHSCDLGEASVSALQNDASSRRYFRVEQAGKSYLLMVARPSEHDLSAFISIDRHLRSLGLAAPEIYAEDKAEGYLLLQDFGDDLFSRLLKGSDPLPLYTAAIDVLTHLHRHKDNAEIALPPYNSQTLYNEAELFPLWYMRHELSLEPSDEFLSDYRQIILEAIDSLPPLPPCLVLRDYHIDNLMQIKGFTIGKDDPLQACGLLDFQDALIGSPAYDVMSILEDARTPVDEAIQTAMRHKYLQETALSAEAFDAHYEVLALIRHLKVLGIFVRLAVRDNKPQYRDYLPHVKNLALKHLLGSPVWQKLKALLAGSVADF